MCTLLASLSVFCLLVWLPIGTLLWLSAREVRDLEGLLPPIEARPRVSVIVTARDEGPHIEATVRRILDQRSVELQLIVVDDRSSDLTGSILDQLQAELGPHRLTVVHNERLPPGWIGKCYACHIGAKLAVEPWLLFMDGDVTLTEPDTLARTLGWAEAEQIDHVAVIPDTAPSGSLLTAVLMHFGSLFLLASRAFEMSRDRPRGGGGVGAFNLVQRSAYDRVDGHRVLKFDPADDFKLGVLLKEAGAKQRIVNGIRLVVCRWHTSTLGLLRGLEKNFFGGLNYSLVQTLFFSVCMVAAHLGPWALALLGWLTCSAQPKALAMTQLPLLSLYAALFAGIHHARRFGASVGGLALFSPAALVMVLIAWNSAYKTLSQGGIRWRDTFYSLASLRSGRVRAGTGLRFNPAASGNAPPIDE